jgi:hypothetical protein
MNKVKVKMPVRTKYEDAVYEKVVFSGKIFMYNTVSWNVIFPIVDIIRLLKKNTIIGYVHGKAQQTISTYGSQYNHRMVGYDLKNKRDYLENLKAVRVVFMFSDEKDNTIVNLTNIAKRNKINVVCYSNLDKIYHFYDHVNETVYKFIEPIQVVDKMYNLIDLEGTRKIADLFPEFDILETEPVRSESSLAECSRILREKRGVVSKLYDPNIAKIRAMEAERNSRNTVYPDSMEELNKAEHNQRKTLLSRFFKK